jgi:hypothetical protein
LDGPDAAKAVARSRGTCCGNEIGSASGSRASREGMNNPAVIGTSRSLVEEVGAARRIGS